MSDAPLAATADRRRFPLRPPEPLLTAVSVFAGILLPVFCLTLIASGAANEPAWQSGDFHDYVYFLLDVRVVWVFVPFHLFATACLILVLTKPEQAAEYTFIRYGLYSGVPLSLQYAWILGVVVLNIDKMDSGLSLIKATLGIAALTAAQLVTPVLVWGLLLGCLIVLSLLSRRLSPLVSVALIFLTALGLVGSLIALAASDNEQLIGTIAVGVFIVVLYVPFFSAPAWSMAVYAYQSYRVMRMQQRQFQVKLWQFILIFSWVGAYFGAWRAAVSLMLDAYAKLPINPPETCYLATAAAHGSPHVVNSWPVTYRDGSAGRANKQLAYLKCGELALLALTPRLHRFLRRLYDYAAPSLARRLKRPLLANAMYFALKPPEWSVRLALTLLLRSPAKYVERLYRA